MTRSPSHPVSDRRGGLRFTLLVAALIAIVVGGLAVAEFAYRLQADVVTGKVRIIDGDSIAFGDLNVRLASIDAPERAQSCSDAKGEPFGCGRSATDYLRFLIGNGEVTCRGRGRDRYGRMIGACRANGIDLSAEMVRRGWAVAYLGDLGSMEAEARSLGVGLWAGEFVAPSEWRRDRRSATGYAPIGAVREAIARLAALANGDRALRAPADG